MKIKLTNRKKDLNGPNKTVQVPNNNHKQLAQFIKAHEYS